MDTKTLPAPEPTAWRQLNPSFEPLDPGRVESLLKQEWQRFTDSYPNSGEHNVRSAKVLPLGVASSFQHWDPYPVSIASARGAYLRDVDGKKLLDLSMGFGAMLVGHLNPRVVKRVRQALRSTGTLFAMPSLITTEAAERFQRRFSIDMLRFTNSGTESTMYAIRVARGATGKKAIVKIEGGFHGGYDPLTVSVKPPLDMIGSADAPISYYPKDAQGGEVFVVSYNDLDGLRNLFEQKANQIAALVMEPVIENLSIILPDAGYLRGVRELCTKHGVALIFDEVKTGLTAGVAGAARRIGVEPDLICLAKSIGGGLPIAAYGGKREFMQAVVDGRSPHLGTYNGNPIGMAAAIAVDEIATEKTLAEAERINLNTLAQLDKIIADYRLPAHTVGFGVKGAVTWSGAPVRNYRDFKAVDFEAAELGWLWGINRGVITPPGLDEQWLVSFAHKDRDMAKLVSAIGEMAVALRS